jgi:hypothetical protein
MRGLWSTLGLVVVLAGLGGYIYFVDSKRPASSVEEKPKVFTIEADKIDELTVTSERETSTLRKNDGTWKMTAPVEADADSNEVSNIASSLASLEVTRVVEEKATNLADYGLAEPRIKLAFKGQGGATGELLIGNKTPAQGDLYAMKPGETRVFLVPAFQETTFAKKPFDLRDKKILKFEREKVDSIEVAQAGSPAIVLARSGTDWSLKQPVQARADYSAVEGLLTRLSTANMSKLIDTAGPAPLDPDAMRTNYGLDKPAVTATLGAGSTRATLALGKEEGGAVYARDQSRDLVFAVEPSLATDLKKTADDYRDKDLFEFRNFNASRLRIARGSDVYEFQKVAGSGENASEKWQRVVAGGAATDVDGTKMEDLLTKLTSLRAQSFTAEGATGLDKPLLTVSASYDQGKFERVRIAKPAVDAFGAREGEPGAAKLDAVAYEDLITALDAAVAPPAPAAAPATNQPAPPTTPPPPAKP